MDKKPDYRLIDLAVCPEGTQQERALKIASMYGKRPQLEARLAGRREPVEYPFLLKMALESADGISSTQTVEEIIANIPPSRPAAREPSALRVTYELAKDGLSWIGKVARYAAYGALPAETQERLAKERGENALTYSRLNQVIGIVGGAGIVIDAIVRTNGFGKNYGLAEFIGGMCIFTAGIIRRVSISTTSKTISAEPAGMVTLALPKYTVELAAELYGITKKSLSAVYTKKKEALTTPARPSLEVRVEDIPALPADTTPAEPVYLERESNAPGKKMTHG